MLKRPLIFSAAALILAVTGYYAGYWLVIATSRLTGAKIVSLSVSEFFTYQLAIALMFLFCGVCAVINKRLMRGLFTGRDMAAYGIAFAAVFSAAAVFVVIRFFILKASAAVIDGEQTYLFLASLSYATWGSIGAVVSLALSALLNVMRRAALKKSI